MGSNDRSVRALCRVLLLVVLALGPLAVRGHFHLDGHESPSCAACTLAHSSGTTTPSVVNVAAPTIVAVAFVPAVSAAVARGTLSVRAARAPPVAPSALAV